MGATYKAASRSSRSGPGHAIRAEHERIATLVSALNSVLSSSPIDWSAADRARAVGCIEELQVVLSKHFAREEESGYVSAATELAPQLDRIARKLLAQHDALCSGLDELEARARAARADDEVQEFRALARAWIRSMREHEREENRLIQRAYAEDLGGRG